MEEGIPRVASLIILVLCCFRPGLGPQPQLVWLSRVTLVDCFSCPYLRFCGMPSSSGLTHTGSPIVGSVSSDSRAAYFHRSTHCNNTMRGCKYSVPRTPYLLWLALPYCIARGSLFGSIASPLLVGATIQSGGALLGGVSTSYLS